MCIFELDISCNLISDMLTHINHEHLLILSSTSNYEECSACNLRSKIFHCTKYEFILDFRWARLPFTIMYKQHEHPFTLRHIVEDNSEEYYWDIVRKNEVLNIGFTIVKSAVIPLIPNAFWESQQISDFGTGQISSLGRLTQPTSTNIPSLLFITLGTIYVQDVVNFALIIDLWMCYMYLECLHLF